MPFAIESIDSQTAQFATEAQNAITAQEAQNSQTLQGSTPNEIRTNLLSEIGANIGSAGVNLGISTIDAQTISGQSASIGHIQGTTLEMNTVIADVVDAGRFIGDGSSLTNVWRTTDEISAPYVEAVTLSDGSGLWTQGKISVNEVDASTVTADFFVGDGSGLTGVGSSNLLHSGNTSVEIDTTATGVGEHIHVNVDGVETMFITSMGVGVLVSSPSAAMEVAGTVAADFFVGDGSGLSGVLKAGEDVSVGVLEGVTVTDGSAYLMGGNLIVTNVDSSGTVTASAFVGDGSGLSGVLKAGEDISVGVLEGVTITDGSAHLMGGNLIVSNIDASGVVTAAAYYGDGSNLTGVSSSPGQVAGTAGVLFDQIYISRDSGNVLHGSNAHTHVNLGMNSETGLSGQDYQNATVGGGSDNIASEDWATVAGGFDNTASGHKAAVGGGYQNTASGSYAAINGGKQNTASGEHSTIGGGQNNTANIGNATIGGGQSNWASGGSATVAGGHNNQALHVWSTVGGGQNNKAKQLHSTVSGGKHNIASGINSAIPGGSGLEITGGGSMGFRGGDNSSTITREVSNTIYFLETALCVGEDSLSCSESEYETGVIYSTAVNSSGNITAAAFYGDGSNLINLSSVFTDNTTSIIYNAGNMGLMVTDPDEKLVVGGKVRLEPTTDTASLDGTIRYSGEEFEARLDNEWVEIRTSPTSASTNSTDRIAPVLPLGAYFLNAETPVPEGFAETILARSFDLSIEQLPDLPRVNRNVSTNSVLHQGQLYIVGGHDGTSVTSNVLIYDFGSTQWTQGPSMPIALNGHSVVSLGNSIYSICGLDASDTRTDAVFVLDTITQSWSSGVSFPIAKHVGAAFSDGIRLYYLGGDKEHQANDTTRKDIWSFEPGKDISWFKEPTVLPQKFAQGTYTSTGEKFYLMGSEEGFGPNVAMSVFDPGAGSANALATLPVSHSRNNVAFNFNNKIYLIGGSDNPRRIDEYDIASDTWFTITQTLPVDLISAGWAQDHGSGYILGDSDDPHFLVFTPPQDRNFVQLVDTEEVGDDLVPFSASILTRDANSPAGYTALNESVESDSAISTLASFPTALYSSANNLVYSDNKVYTMFGELNSTFTDLVYAYDVNSDSWSIETTAPFVARKHNGAVSYKGNLYSFGGLLSPIEFHSTETLIYSTQSGWTTGPAIPQGLQQIEAAVADNFIYLVGGHSGFSNVASAYAWDPETGVSWSTLSSLNVGRTQHCVVGYQGKVYVFGGLNDGTATDSSLSREVYDPQSDSWSLHSNELPEAISGHKCVTLGDRIYLIGGDLGGGNGKSKVFEFDPVTASYTQLEDYVEGLSFPTMATDGQAIYINTRANGNFRRYRPEGKFFVHQNQTGGQGADLPQSLAVVETTSAAIEGFDSSGSTLESTAGTDFFLHFRNTSQLTSLVGVYDDFRDQDGDSGLFVSSDSNSNEVEIRSGGVNRIEIEKDGTVEINSDIVDVDGIVTLGVSNLDSAEDGSIRWTGSDLQIRQGGTWNSLTESQVKEIRDADGDTFITVDNGSDPDFIDFQVNGMVAMTINTDSNVGIGTTQPQEKLEVNGAVLLGNTGNNNPGSIRFNGSDFEGFDGGSWTSFTSGSSSAGSSGIGENSFIGAGIGNSATSTGAFVGAGSANSAANQNSVVVGGDTNSANADKAFVGGGYNNQVNGLESVIVGGNTNQISGQLAAIVGGFDNFAGGSESFVGGGKGNSANNDFSSVVGGKWNTATADYVVVAGGLQNQASSTSAFIGGGELNNVSGGWSGVAGGMNNAVGGQYSAIPGGKNLTVNSDNTFAFNGSANSVIVSDPYSRGVFFVDHFSVNTESTFAMFEVSANSETELMILRDESGNVDFVVDAGGRVGIGTDSPGPILDVVGNMAASGDITASGNLIGTLSTGAQPNITSVGTLATADIDGGTLDDVTIGATTAANATFTDVIATGNLDLSSSATPLVTLDANDYIEYDKTNNKMKFSANNYERLVIDGNSWHVQARSAQSMVLDINAGDNTYSNIHFNHSDTTNKWSISSRASFDTPNDRLGIWNAGASSEKFTILQTGSVGIGTNSPSQKLHVAGSGTVNDGLDVGFIGTSVADRIRIGDANFYADLTSATAPIIAYDSNDYETYDRTNNMFKWFSGGAEMARLDSAANMSIGTTSFVNGLVAWGELSSIQNTGEARFHLYNFGNQAEWKMGQKSGVDHDYYISKIVAGTEFDYFMIDYASGNTGIGTTAPATKLDVAGNVTLTNGGGSAVLTIDTTATSGVSRVDLKNDGTSQWFIDSRGTAEAPNNRLSFFNNVPTEVVTVLQDGNLGLGTTNPSSKLHVIGDITATGIDSSGVVTASDLEFSDGTALGGDFVAFRAKKNGVDQPLLGTGASFLVTFEAELFDYGNNYDTTTSKFTAPVKGVYQFHVLIKWTATTDDVNFQLLARKNSEGGWRARHIFTGKGTQEESSYISFISQLNASDTMHVEAIQSSGSSKNVGHNEGDSYFQGYLIRKVP
jgi:hypothetical protein